jgi:hypothetical protein
MVECSACRKETSVLELSRCLCGSPVCRPCSQSDDLETRRVPGCITCLREILSHVD